MKTACSSTLNFKLTRTTVRVASVPRCDVIFSFRRVSKILNFQSVAFVQGKWDGRGKREFDFFFLHSSDPFFFFFFFREKTKSEIHDSKGIGIRVGTIIEIPVSWRKISRPGREQTGCFLFQGPIYFLSYIFPLPTRGP